MSLQDKGRLSENRMTVEESTNPEDYEDTHQNLLQVYQSQQQQKQQQQQQQKPPQLQLQPPSPSQQQQQQQQSQIKVAPCFGAWNNCNEDIEAKTASLWSPSQEEDNRTGQMSTFLQGVTELVDKQRLYLREVSSRCQELEQQRAWVEAQMKDFFREDWREGESKNPDLGGGPDVHRAEDLKHGNARKAVSHHVEPDFPPMRLPEGACRFQQTFDDKASQQLNDSEFFQEDSDHEGDCVRDVTVHTGSGDAGSKKKKTTVLAQTLHSSSSSLLLRLMEEEKELEEENNDDITLMGAPWYKRLVASPRFDLSLGGMIIANTVVMSLQIEYTGRILEKKLKLDGGCIDTDCSNEKWESVEFGFAVAEQIFTAVFAIELALRLAADGPRYLKTFANIGDALIVIVSSLDSWVLTPIGSNGMQNVAILRLVRLVRLSKVLRVVRVMKAFKSLRVLVSAVANSVGALAWSMTLLFVLELIGAIFLAQVLQPMIEEDTQDEELRDWLQLRFGTWLHAMMSLFEITMAPGGFLSYRMLYEEVHIIFGVFLVVYVCVVTFAVVRVITAMFLKATLSASDTDEERLWKEKAERREAGAARLIEQVGPEGCVEYEEFTALLELASMKEWLAETHLTPEGAIRLFSAMDDGDGRVVFAEYVNAILNIRPNPAGADSTIMLHEMTNLADKLKKLEEAVNQASWAIFYRPNRMEPALSGGDGERSVTTERSRAQTRSVTRVPTNLPDGDGRRVTIAERLLRSM